MQNTAVIIPIFNFSPKRLAGVRKVLEKLKKQSAKPNIYLIELSFNDESISQQLKDFPDVKIFSIHGEKGNRDLWQKEALLNASLNYINGEDYIIFLDADVYPESSEWVTQVEKVLGSSSNVILQPYCNVIDSKTESRNFSSIASYVSTGRSDFAPHGAGTAWAFRRSEFESFGGFNPLYPEGSGDTGFIMEFLSSKSSCYPNYLHNYGWFNSLMRPRKPEFKLEYINENLIHVNHGDERFYVDRCSYMNLLQHDIADSYHIDSKGLLSWSTDKCHTKDIVKLLLRKIDSEFVNFGRESIYKLWEDNKISFKPYNPVAVTEECSVVACTENWPSVLREGNKATVEPVFPISNEHPIELWINVSSKFDYAILFAPIEANETMEIHQSVYATDYSTLLKDYGTEKAPAGTDLRFKYPRDENDFLWKIKLSGDNISKISFIFSSTRVG